MFEDYNNDVKISETKAARKLGESIALKYFKKPFIDVQHLLEATYGININKMDMSENIFALVDLDSHEIHINTNKSEHQTRFTLAHELGHIALNHKVRKWTEYGDYLGRNPDNQIEEEANAFASGLLIPGKMLRNSIKTVKDPVRLSELFNVSKEAMWYSLDTNRLINKL